VGRNVSLLMPSPHHEEHDAYLERYLTTGEAKIIGLGREVTGRRRDGSSFPSPCRRRMSIGGERKFTGMLRDLTRRMNLEGQLGASEARWQAVVDSAVDGIIVIDAHGRVETFNPAAERLFGYAAADVIGHNVDMLMPSPYREEHDTYLSRYLATNRAKVIGIGREVQGRRKDGTTFPLHLSVGQITIGGERRFTGILHDLSSRVAMEASDARAGGAGQARRDGSRGGARGEEPARGHTRRHAGVREAAAARQHCHAGPQGHRVAHRLARPDDEGPAAVRAPPKPRRGATDVAPLVSMTARS
jgi:PAS domain S-box-containing protein